MRSYRVLVLLLFSAVCILPAVAQSLPGSLAPSRSNGVAGAPTGTVLPTASPNMVLTRVGPVRAIDADMLAQNDLPCYSIRAYRFKRDDANSDATKPAGYSTCQPANRFHVKGVESR